MQTLGLKPMDVLVAPRIIAMILMTPALAFVATMAGIAGGILVRRRGELGGFLNFILLVVGAFVLVALGLIPLVGPIIVLIAMLLGLGAFPRTLGHRLRRSEPAAAVI